jgi:hypothetical protein
LPCRSTYKLITMKFKRIFGVRAKGYLQAVIYPEDHPMDIFRKLFNLWNNTQYLLEFFEQQQDKLNTQYCKYLSVDEAIDYVIDEALEFEAELRALETGPENDKIENENIRELSDIFIQLHKGVYALRPEKRDQRKAKVDRRFTFLRLYAIEVDGCYVVTGGAIKLQEKMEGSLFDMEKKRLLTVQQYLKSENIIGKDGFDD